MQLALPALSELRTSATRDRLFAVSRSMTQVMLLASGAIVAVVLATNRPFVGWWVGEAQFGGLSLTALLLAGMLVRHLNVTAVYALFCFGNERRLAVTSIADGLTGLVAMLVLVPRLGLHGAALGPLLATCLVSLPNNLRALAREEGTSATTLLTPLIPWATRLAVLLTSVGLLISWWNAQGFAGLVLAGGSVSVAYALMMIPVLRRPPLSTLAWPVVRPWLARLEVAIGRQVSHPAS